MPLTCKSITLRVPAPLLRKLMRARQVKTYSALICLKDLEQQWAEAVRRKH